MKKILFLSMFVLTTFLLTGCLGGKGDDSGKTNPNNSSTTDVSSVNSKTYEHDAILFFDESCNKEFCNLTGILAELGKPPLSITKEKIKLVTGDFENWDKEFDIENGTPTLILSETFVSKIEPKNFAEQIQKTTLKEKGYYMFVLGNWIPNSENICFDGKDNDGDGKIDSEDNEDCGKLYLIKDQNCDKSVFPNCGFGTGELKGIFGDMFDIQMVDVNSEIGKELYEKSKGEYNFLPQIVTQGGKFPLTIKKLALERKEIHDVDGGVVFHPGFLKTGYYPGKKICSLDSEKLKNEDKYISCDNSECKDEYNCIKEEKGKVDVYLMGYCPFGELAAKEIKGLNEYFKGKITFDTHYIMGVNSEVETIGKVESLHGPEEVQENLRQLCVKKEYGNEKLFDYFLDRYSNPENDGSIKKDIQETYNTLKIDSSKIDSCIEKDGLGLLKGDGQFAINNKIGGSPTWIINKKFKTGGYNKVSIIKEICKYNEGIEMCKKEQLDNLTGDVNGIAPTNGEGPSCNSNN